MQKNSFKHIIGSKSSFHEFTTLNISKSMLHEYDGFTQLFINGTTMELKDSLHCKKCLKLLTL